jgi:5-methyltetrahydrofolate--homocysteine methyltransferase
MIIIGEKINATIPAVKELILNRDKEKLLELAKRQAKASYIDVNVATGVGTAKDEITAMQWAIQAIQDEVSTPLCVDSADPLVLEAGLSVLKSSGLINSTTAEEKSLKNILPLAKKYNMPIIGLAMGEKGIPNSIEGRISACQKIATASEATGISLDNLYFDPLVMPISTDAKQGVITLNTLDAIRKEFPQAKTVMALSNVSFGLPARMTVNTAFLHIAIFMGLSAAIMDPEQDELIAAIRTGEAIIGKDRHFRRYIRAYRKASN